MLKHNIKLIKKDQLSRILIEIFSIVFAVMLSLFLNEWRQNINKNKKVSLALHNIKLEVIENKESLENVIKNQQAFIDTLEKLNKTRYKSNQIKHGFIDIYLDIQKRIGSGLKFSHILTTAWESALNTGIANDLDYEIVVKLSEIHSATKIVNQRIENMSSMLLNKDIFKTEETSSIKNALSLIIRDLIQEEKDLITLYDGVLLKLKDY